jgi:RNA polymerase sigma factor (sigma-70 family)
VNEPSDSRLLEAYVKCRSESAFAQLVERHVNLVYSAALRMLGDAHSSRDVTQGVFIALAQNAPQLARRPALAGWLHCTTRNLAAKWVRSDMRRRAREQEAAAMNELHSAGPDAHWTQISAHLDEALAELKEPDREALLLRYFKNQDLRTVGAAFGVSEDAAQKRVSRAVEHLREFLARRGVTVGTSGLAVAISTSAVQAAPVGLAAEISIAALALGTTATATTTIVMTTLQKALIGATLAAAVGTGIWEAQQAATARAKSETLQHQQAALTAEMEQLRRERDGVTTQLAALRDQNEALNRNQAELLRLRGEVGRLRREVAGINRVTETPRAAQIPEPAAGVSIPVPTAASPAVGQAEVKWDSALLLANIKMPTGKTAGLFAIPKRGDVAGQLRIDTRLVEWPDGFAPPPTDGTQKAAVGVLSSEQVDMVLKTVKDSGAKIIGSPSVAMWSGREAQVEIGGMNQAATAFPGAITSTPDSSAEARSSASGQKTVIKVAPTISADGETVDLTVETWFETASASEASGK